MQDEIRRWLNQWNLSPLAWNSILIIAALAIGLLLRGLLHLYFSRNSKGQSEYSPVRSSLRHLGAPIALFIPLFLLNSFRPMMQWPRDSAERWQHLLEILLIVCFAWILIRIINVVQDVVVHNLNINQPDNLRVRKIRTQLQFLRRFIISLIILLTVAAVLLTFEAMRKIGTGLLTGVGIGGIIIGFAAQRSLGNLLAGFQIAFTQPIRIDDGVLVEGEFGNVEEITLTYVVVRLWDDRRYVLPINYFIEKPFINYTRTSSALLGTTLLYLDYSAPIDALREEFDRLVKAHPAWDGRASAFQVTNLTERTVELRALMSAADSGKLFDLRCAVREGLLKFVRANYPDALPQDRSEVRVAGAAREAGGNDGEQGEGNA